MKDNIPENNFSVVIPLYNKVEYITRAIESVLKQTYQNFEIVIVNDGSSDGGDKNVELIADSRIKLLHQKNQGVSAARNRGAFAAKFDYIAFLDADDIWDIHFLEEVNCLINKFPSAGIYGTNNYFLYPSGKIDFDNYNYLFNGKDSGVIKDYFGLFAKNGRSPFSNSNFAIPKNIFLNEKGYKEGVKLTEDSDLWCRIALKFDIVYSIKPLATYYIGTTGCSHLMFEAKDFQITITLNKALKLNQVKPIYKKSVKKLIAYQNYSLIMRAILTRNKLFALKRIVNLDLIFHYPFSVLKCIVALVLPYVLIENYQNKKYL